MIGFLKQKKHEIFSYRLGWWRPRFFLWKNQFPIYVVVPQIWVSISITGQQMVVNFRNKIFALTRADKFKPHLSIHASRKYVTRASFSWLRRGLQLISHIYTKTRLCSQSDELSRRVYSINLPPYTRLLHMMKKRFPYFDHCRLTTSADSALGHPQCKQ